MSENDQVTSYPQPRRPQERRKIKSYRVEFRARRKLNRLADLNYAIRLPHRPGAPEMEDENMWKCLKLPLLACFD
jgi:hypothetical protein